VRHFEVTSGLNRHPLFIEALAEATVAQIERPQAPSAPLSVGDGAPAHMPQNGATQNGSTRNGSAQNGVAEDTREGYRLQPLDQMPRFSADRRQVRCHQCECIAEARCWTAEPAPASRRRSASEAPAS
jgi:ferrochelatase